MHGAFPDEIEVETLDAWLRAGERVILLDVREPWEVDLCALDGSLNIPLGSLPTRVSGITADLPVVTVCHHGFRSAQAAAWLRSQGFDRVTNLSGGMDAWARRVDTTMKVY
ncbi:MAG TPA: rhodanese-like domain-containing protein [Azospirillaceae bacterium]|nr:rhodanese-like domain-containing protein [Azospirillaceae bacterium]